MDDIYSFIKQENPNYIGAVHFSALTFILFPLGNIILPTILWLARKGNIVNLTYFAKKLLNFQITWTIITYYPFAIMSFQNVLHVKLPLGHFRGFSLILFIVIMYGLNLIYTIIAGILSIKDGRRNLYPVAIPFMKT